MTDSNENTSLEGWEPKIDSQSDLCDALDKAFEYRGDITLALKADEIVEGFLFNRDFTSSHPHVVLYPSSENSAARKIPLTDIESIVFSGKDTATGNSWEAWVAKWETKHGPR